MRKTYVLECHGEQAADRYLANASQELVAAVKAAERFDDWVDFGLFIEATELVDGLFGHGDKLLAWGVGRFAAEHNMGLWKAMFMRVMTPTMILNVAAGLWGHHYDAGKLTVEEEGTGALRVKIRDFPWPHRAHCLSIGGWIERSLELGRPHNVEVREEKCRALGWDECEFSLRWG